MDRQRFPSRLRNAGDLVSSGGSPVASPSQSQRQYSDRGSLVHATTRAADHARGQVQVALDGLLGDDPHLAPPSPSGYEPLSTNNQSPGGQSQGRRRISFQNAQPEPIAVDASSPPRDQLSAGAPSPPRKPSGLTVESGGYTPTAAGSRRRRGSSRSPKRYSMGVSQGHGINISTLEELKIFLEEKQSEVVKAHGRRTKELDTILSKEERYFGALLDNQLEKQGITLKATSAMLRGNSVSDGLFRRGSKRLSHDGVDEALQSKHADEIKKADHLRKKLKTHHEEARSSMTKKLQVESARMGRVIKTNLGKYANPKLAQGAKGAVLTSVVEYLNGEEFVRIVRAPVSYQSPDFVLAMGEEQAAMGIAFSPTNVQRSSANFASEAVDFDSKMAQLEEKRRQEKQQQMAVEAMRHTEMLARENRAAMEQKTADALARANEENLKRQQEMQRQQDEELEAQRRQLVEHQERLQAEAEVARLKHKEELDLRRAEMEREREAILAQQAEAKRLQEEQLEKQREEMQRKHDEDMERQRKEIAKHAEEVARHKAELAKRNEEARLEQEALEQMRKREQDEEDGERRRLEEEVAKHQEQMRLEEERVKMEMEALNLERENVARAEAAERAAEEEARQAQEAQAAANALKAAQDDKRRQSAEAAMRAQIEAELEARVARDIQAERDRVAAESAALQAKMREFEEQREAAAAQAAADREVERAAAELAAADREAAVAAREREAAQKLVVGRPVSQTKATEMGYHVGDKVDALCTPVGAPAGTKAFTPGEVATVNPDGSLDVTLSDGRMIQHMPVAEVSKRASPAGLSGGTEAGGYRAGDKVDALCTPVGAPAGTKAFIPGEVAIVNPDGSLDVILSDGRLKQDVPLAEVQKRLVKESGGYQVGDEVDALCTPVGAPAGTKAFIPGEVENINPDGSLDVLLSDGRTIQNIPLADLSKRASPTGLSGGTEPGEYQIGDEVDALCTPVGAPAGTKAFIPGEVANVNPDGSLDVRLSDGRMMKDVPLAEVSKSTSMETEEYHVGDKVDALCTPVGAPAGTKAFIPGEVANVNPDGSLDVVLSDERMIQHVPVTEVLKSASEVPEGHRVGDKVEALCTPVGAPAGTKTFLPGEVYNINPDGSLDIILSDGRTIQHVPVTEVLKSASEVPEGHRVGDKVEALCTPVGAPAGTKAFLPGEVSNVNPDRSLDVVLSDGRTIQHVPVTEVLKRASEGPEGHRVGDKVEALCTPVGAPAGTKAFLPGEVSNVNPDGSLDVALSDGRRMQRVPLAEVSRLSSNTKAPADLSRGPKAVAYHVGDKVDALCSPLGAPAGTKAFVPGEVSNVNPGGSLDVILSDGRMIQHVPLAEVSKRTLKEPEEYRVGDEVDALCTPVGAPAGTKAFIPGEVAKVNPDRSLDVRLSDGRMVQNIPLAEVSKRASKKSDGRHVGDKVDALCTPVGAPAGTKAFIPGEVANVNPDGSLNVILADGRMVQDVPLTEIKNATRSAESDDDDDDHDDDDRSNSRLAAARKAQAVAESRRGDNVGDSALSPSALLDQHRLFGRVPNNMAQAGSQDDILGSQIHAAAAAEAARAASAGAEKTVSVVNMDGNSGENQGKVNMKKRGSLDDILGIKVGKPVVKGLSRGATTTILQEGDTVEALAPPSASGSGGGAPTFSPGMICRVHHDGSVDVDLDTGDKLVKRPPKEVRLVRKNSSSRRPPVAMEDLAEGDRVEARYGGSPDFLPGVVTSVEDGVSVNFDAGWHGASIPLAHIRRPSANRNSSLPVSGPRAGHAPSLSDGARIRAMGSILDLDVGSLGGDTFSQGEQVQLREKVSVRAGPPQTHNGVIRSAHPNGSYQVGFKDGSMRDQVDVGSLTGFEWTPDRSADYRRALGEGHETASTPNPTNGTEQTTGDKRQDPAFDNDEGGDAADGGPNGKRLSKSLRNVIFDKFGASARVSPEGALGSTARGAGGERRSTHAGLVGGGHPGLKLNMVHFSAQEFMDPDTAAQAILTPNNAGMFRKGGGPGQGPGQGHRQVLSELSYNSSTDDSDTERGETAAAGNDRSKKTQQKKEGFMPLGNAPKRRMTFGGFRSDTKGEVYKSQRRPSFMENVAKRAVGVAEAAVKATRINIQGNNGQGFELVAIGDRKKSFKKTRRQSQARTAEGGDEESDDSLCEDQTHFYNRTRHVFEPQHTESAPSAWWIRTCGIINLICMATYLWWRCLRSLIGVNHIIWGYIFLSAECIMAIGMIVGHSSRSFPVHREKVYMDDLTDTDEAIGALKVAVLIPTCGEKTAVMLKALFGNLQLRLWRSQNARQETLRIVVLDEKNREEVQKLVSLVYTLAEVVLDKTVREILMREGVAPISAKGFYGHFANGDHGQRMYDDVNFIRGIEIVTEIDKLIAANDDSFSRFSPSVAISRIKERARRASCFDRKEITPGQKKVWNRNKYIPTIVYYSRIDAGQPRISPKAGNMNRAIFSFNPAEEPLIGQAAVVVVNDVRHELYPEFLQRTVPYFFTFDKIRRCYKWADIAFIQTPQRFHDRKDWNDPDPLGNQAATQFDIVNSGRDGAGGALSCGQGSVWRVQVLRDGIRPDGTKYLKKGSGGIEDQVGRQGGLGFRAEVLIEDTHTSIDLFRQGWKSVYVNFPNEILARCTLPPDTVKWRWKQVLRWHQGAVQLAMWKGWGYAMTGETWATFFQKVFAFDAVSYFLQAFAGEILLIFPVVYGFTNSAPFNTWNIEFALYFFPFIITGVLPTVAALGWQKTPSSKVMRDEQIWFATSFVQIYAVMHAVWGTITRKDPSNAWECKCPVWPLYFHFVIIIVAVVFNTVGWVGRSYEEPWVWVSCIGSSLFALHSLWPVVSFGLGVTMPEAFYTRVFGMLVIMTLVSMWLLGEQG